MRVLVTRPSADAERTAARLAARGHAPVIAPLMRVVPVPAELPAGIVALLATSANAFVGFTATPAERTLPVFCVGERTADAARAAGHPFVESADGDVEALVRLVLTRFDEDAGPLAYLAGEERTGDLEGRLARLGFAVEVRVVYRALPVEAFDAPTIAALAAGVDAVLLYSRRTADIFSGLIRAAGLADRLADAALLCLSPQVAAGVTVPGRIVVADRAREDALFARLDALAPRPETGVRGPGSRG